MNKIMSPFSFLFLQENNESFSLGLFGESCSQTMFTKKNPQKKENAKVKATPKKPPNSKSMAVVANVHHCASFQ